MDKMASLAAACVVLSLSCSTECYPEFDFTNFTNYPTPTSAPSAEDQMTLQRVYDCLLPLNEHWLSAAEAIDAECWIRPKIELRGCIKVAVAPDWYVSTHCSSGEQVFPCNIGPERCIEKGEMPTASCPCRCRAQIQDATTIWVTPNRKLLPAYAVTLMTGCLSPWTPSLAKCSNLKP